jgi:signal peptidase II
MTSAADRRPFWIAIVTTLVLDQATKYLAESSLPRFTGVPVLGDWFQLRLVHNQGAAFGLHVGPYSRWVFLLVALVAIGVLARMAWLGPAGDRFRQLALGLVAGGAAGNLIDRIHSARGVVDFLDVGIGDLRWPTFNVADIAVSCGALALAWALWGEDHEPAHAPAPAPRPTTDLPPANEPAPTEVAATATARRVDG